MKRTPPMTVLAIRRDLSMKRGTQQEIANRYGVSRQLVQKLKLNYDKRSQVAECGTNAAYMRNLRNDELADDDCLRAHAQENKQWKDRHGQGQNSPQAV